MHCTEYSQLPQYVSRVAKKGSSNGRSHHPPVCQEQGVGSGLLLRVCQHDGMHLEARHLWQLGQPLAQLGGPGACRHGTDSTGLESESCA